MSREHVNTLRPSLLHSVGAATYGSRTIDAFLIVDGRHLEQRTSRYLGRSEPQGRQREQSLFYCVKGPKSSGSQTLGFQDPDSSPLLHPLYLSSVDRPISPCKSQPSCAPLCARRSSTMASSASSGSRDLEVRCGDTVDCCCNLPGGGFTKTSTDELPRIDDGSTT